jgi:hypothetical protein
MIKAKCLLGCMDQHFSDSLRAVLTECDRLREHPELFADGARAKRFLITAYYYAREIMDFTEARKKLDENLEAIFCFNAANHPARPADYDHYKPWVSYLSPGAPGSGVRINVTNKDACLQVIPEAGLKLLKVWSAETAHVAQRLRQVSLVS